MAAIPFEPWPKIARLNRDIVVTEKIDGTNAAVVILPLGGTPAAKGQPLTVDNMFYENNPVIPAHPFEEDERHSTVRYRDYVLFAQSRTRFITPQSDNFGFARWVSDNAIGLFNALGVGTHFGEWWGKGIQRGYGRQDRSFSLFNTSRWDADGLARFGVPGLTVVPTLYQGPFDQDRIDQALQRLANRGSEAAPGYTDPEGVVVYHTAANTSFKVAIKNDQAPKGNQPPLNLWGA